MDAAEIPICFNIYYFIFYINFPTLWVINEMKSRKIRSGCVFAFLLVFLKKRKRQIDVSRKQSHKANILKKIIQQILVTTNKNV